MAVLRPIALLKQVAAVPFHFVQHQWKHQTVSIPEKYTFGRHPRQYLMFWMPPKTVELRNSVVMFYHGGGWRLGWPDQFPTVAAWFLTRGFPIVMPAYRLLPKYAFPEMYEDVVSAHVKTLEIMHNNGLGQKSILPAGMSAGATLAAHLAFNERNSMDNKTPFSGFLSFGGPLELIQLPDVAQLRRFTKGAFGSQVFQAVNPVNLLSGQEKTPILLVHGTDDAIVPFASSENFYAHYSGPKQLWSIEGGSHLDSLGFALNDHKTSAIVEEWLFDL